MHPRSSEPIQEALVEELVVGNGVSLKMNMMCQALLRRRGNILGVPMKPPKVATQQVDAQLGFERTMTLQDQVRCFPSSSGFLQSVSQNCTISGNVWLLSTFKVRFKYNRTPSSIV